MNIFDNEGFEEFDLDAEEPAFTTGVVSKLINIPVWALKMIDTEGLVSPDREERKARLYSKNHLVQIQKIWYLMDQKGVTLKGVKVILEMEK